MSLEILGVLREEPTEFHLRRSGPSASLLRRQSGGLTSRGCSPPGLQAVSGLCQPPETWGSASLKQASRSLTCWRVAIGEETELHEHDCFSTQTDFREMPRPQPASALACKVHSPDSSSLWVPPLPASALPVEGCGPWVWEQLPFIHTPSCFRNLIAFSSISLILFPWG